jgi:flagellar motor component MotA
VLIAHLVALPISEKLRAKSVQERENRLLIIEGIVQIHGRQNPSVLVEILESYLPEKQRIGGEGVPAARNRRASDTKTNPAAAALRRRTTDRQS